ncbi:MAG: GntR family transcriptional regulator [Pseudomonadota bacterium]
MSDWEEGKPIYLQLREAVLRSIVSGALPEGEAVPSVRQVAADEKVNPITVSKAYQMLVDEELLEKRRGLGMFVMDGARTRALEAERRRFLSDEWPDVQARIALLGLDLQALLEGVER